LRRRPGFCYRSARVKVVVLPGIFLAAALLAVGLNGLALRRWKRAREAHWTERARLLWPARVGALLNVWLLPVNLVLASQWLPLDWRPRVWLGLAAGIAGAQLGGWPFVRQIIPELSFRGWLRELPVPWIFRFAPWLVLVVAIVVMPLQFNALAAGLALGLLAMFGVWQFGLGVRALGWLGLMRPASPRLHALVAECAAHAGATVRGTWELPSVVGQAYALPATRELLFTTKALALFSDAELATICAHELAHLKESRWVLAGRILSSLALYPLIFTRPLSEAVGVVALPVLLGTMIAVVLFGRRLSKRMERQADSAAAATESEPGAYARALEKLHEANQIPAVVGRQNATHPELYDRLVAANVTPAYPRPRPPSRMTWSTGLLFFTAAVQAVLLVMRDSPREGDSVFAIGWAMFQPTSAIIASPSPPPAPRLCRRGRRRSR
jgi:Zn-dependent protease with chaperone function